VQKQARTDGRAVLAATTHTDLFEDLHPAVHIHKRFGKEIEVKYYPNVYRKECSLTREMVVVKASLKDYEELAGFHYRQSGNLPVVHKVFALKRGEEMVGVIIYKSPTIHALGRLLTVGRKVTLQELNKDWTVIGRVVVHPKYRSMGLGAKMVRDTLFRSGRPYVETLAVMARYNPFFEKAGMRRVAESKPDKRVQKALTNLSEIGFNPVLLSSQAYNARKLRDNNAIITKVKEILLNVKSGIYWRLLASDGKRTSLTKNDFENILEKVEVEKLAKMLQKLSFLAQSKVYLFWKNEPALSFIKFLQPSLHIFGLERGTPYTPQGTL